MCGFAGFLSNRAINHEETISLLTAMTEPISRRGPDDSDTWCDPENGIGFGFRRLSIIDLSFAGRQPMRSASGRYVISFNGEIYNHKLLRNELEARGLAPDWLGHSDTETLLAGIEAWGLQSTIEQCVGMFAIALWDRKERELSLVIDRLGEKPLYHCWIGSGAGATFLFGSELTVFTAHPGFRGKVDRGALCLLLRQSYIPSPYTIFEGVKKLEPGHILTVSLRNHNAQPKPYWSFEGAVLAGAKSPFTGTPEAAVGVLERLLKQAIAGQMEADVPLGAFLSGGVDSSTIVALMQEISTKPINTFTIGFYDTEFDEAIYSRDIARHLGTEHTELYVTPQQALDVIPALPQYYSEPFADSSQIPTFLVSQLAQKKVTVSLSGDAGDELFCGYNRYVYSSRLFHHLKKIPRPLRSFVGRAMQQLSPDAWNRLASPLLGLKSTRSLGDKVHKGARVLDSESIDDIYMGLISQNTEPEAWVIGGIEPKTRISSLGSGIEWLSDVERMMVLDAVGYLPGDILVKLDRATMAASLEGRIPFLDHRVVEFSWTLPQNLKLRNGVSKWILREILFKRVPKSLIERPKMGFGIPLDTWLRGPLRAWAEELIDTSRLQREGYFNPAPVRAAWTAHLSGSRNLGHQLWPILMYQAWLEKYSIHS